MNTWVLDIECYRNYLLVMFVNPITGRAVYHERFNDIPLNTLAVPPEGTVVTFNGIGYDMPILTLAMTGASNSELKDAGDSIILGGEKWWEFYRGRGLTQIPLDHIDIMEVLPLRASLKIYGARNNSGRLQDLPIEPDAIITGSQRAALIHYCYNDCIVTASLYERLKPQIQLRERLSSRYGVDLRSKSDAQIAEAVISKTIEQNTSLKLQKPDASRIVGKTFRYTPPPWLGFQTQQMKWLLNQIQMIDFEIADSGAVLMPKELSDKKISLGNVDYKMGIGGLHSVDYLDHFKAEDGMRLVDIDVTSYYPSIILNCGYYPEHIGPVFLNVYRALVNERLAAKASGDKVTADSLKVCINGSFGKFGSIYSKLYAPELMFHTTLTGQLALLMLIERIEDKVVSANTDGITLHYPESDEEHIKQCVEWWEEVTGFNMEWTNYAALYRRDVNNYLAIKEDGSIKTKGIFAEPDLSKNPAFRIIYDAVIGELTKGVPLQETILNCKDIRKFIAVRKVAGGAVWEGQEYGKSVRWYKSTNLRHPITYKNNGNKVSDSENSTLVMDLPESFPTDIDYDWYIRKARDLWREVAL